MHRTPAHPSAELPAGSVVLSVRRPAAVLAVALVLLLAAEALAVALTADREPPQRWYDAATELRAEMMVERGAADVVFAGTSMAWQDLVPAAFTAADPQSRSAFNVGLAGAVPVVTGRWLLDHVEPSLQPDLVVWGLSSLDLAPAYGQDQLTAWTTSLEGRPGPLGAIERTAADASTLVARRSQLRRPSTLGGETRDGLVADRAAAAAITGPDGERTDPGRGRTAEEAAVQRARLAGWQPDPTDVEAVIRTATALRDRGVAVVLVELPTAPSAAPLHPGGAADLATTARTIALLAGELGVPHVPLSGAYADTDFVDHVHLAPAAAARFTTAVAEAVGDVVPLAAADGTVVDGATDSSTAGAGATDGEAAADAAPPPPPPDPAVAAAVRAWVGAATATAVTDPVHSAAIQQVGCRGAPVPAEERQAAAESLARVDPTTAELLQDVHRAADTLAATCQDEWTWRAAMGQLLVASEAAVRHLEAVVQAEGPWTAAGGAEAAARSASSRDLAVAAVHAYERLHWLLGGAGHPRLHRTAVWWSYAERGHTARIDELTAVGTDVDTVILGTSQARTAVDERRLADQLFGRVLNAGVDGGTIDVTRLWAPVVAERLRPRRVVLFVSGVDVLGGGPDAACPTGRREAFEAATANRGTAFAGVPWLAGQDIGRILADPGGRAPIAAPAIRAYLPDPATDHPQLTPAVMAANGATYLDAYPRNAVCPERIADLQAVVGDLRARGIAVVVATHPVRSELRAAMPPGAVEALDARIAEAARAAGAATLSYTALLPDSQMADLVHVTQAGQTTLTDRLAEDLARLALPGSGP